MKNFQVPPVFERKLEGASTILFGLIGLTILWGNPKFLNQFIDAIQDLGQKWAYIMTAVFGFLIWIGLK